MMGWLVPILAIMLFVGLLVYVAIDNRIRNGPPKPTWRGRSQPHPLSRDRDRSDLHEDAPGYKSFGKLDKSAKDDDDVRRYPFKGVGTQMTEAVFLDNGVYYLVCQFPNDQKLTVDLVAEDDDSRKTITTTAGFNTVSFSVKTGQKYMFHVQAEDQTASWALLVKPL